MDKNKSGLPKSTQELNQDKFINYTRGVMDSYLSEKVEKALDTDSIFGTVSGWVKTVPTTPFEISFDINKTNFKETVYNLLKEKFSAMNIDSSTEFETLRANISISHESEKDKPKEERESSGGITTLVYKK